jgi:hypothetical protein
MNPKGIVRPLVRCIAAGNVPLVLGHPGIGKSEILAQVASLLGYEYLCVYPAISLPEHFQGFPFLDQKSGVADFLPLGWLRRIVEAKSPMLVLLDEIDKAAPTVQSVCAQLVLGRTVGTYKVPDCVKFACAGNRAEDRAGGTRLVSQFVDRCAHFPLEADAGSWLSWVNGDKADLGELFKPDYKVASEVHPEVVSFIQRVPEALDDFDPGRQGRNSTPRSWVFLSRHLHVAEADGEDVTPEEIAAYVSERRASEYVQWRLLLGTCPSYEEAIARPDECRVPDRADAAYATASMVVARAEKKVAEAACKYLIRFSPEITTFALKALAKRGAEFVRNKAFINWAKKEGLAIVS